MVEGGAIIPFLRAQVDSPFDPASMLIWADSLEEAGDLVGAAVLRGLAEGGMPSMHALALDATLCPVAWEPDKFEPRCGSGAGYGYGDGSGGGVGFGDESEDWHWAGAGDGGEPGADEGSNSGVGFADGDGFRHEAGRSRRGR